MTTGLDGLLDQLIHDGRLRDEFETDRDNVLSRFDLSDRQRDALKSFGVSAFVAAVGAASRPCPPAAVV